MTEERPPAEGTTTEATVAEPETFLPGNVAEGRQVFSPDVARHELNLRKQQLNAEEKRHELEEAAKDNASRRRREEFGFYAVLVLVIAALAASLIIGVGSKNADTRNWAQGAFTLILGALLGALAGYFTGRTSK
jgi:hypothetical protein